MGFDAGVVGENGAGVEAVLGHPRHGFEVVAGVPERRIGLLVGRNPEFDVVVVVVLALVVEHAGGEAAGEHVHLLVEHFPADAEIDAELLSLHGRDTAADAQIEAPVAEVVQHADLVVEPDGVVEREQEHQRAQAQP